MKKMTNQLTILVAIFTCILGLAITPVQALGYTSYETKDIYVSYQTLSGTKVTPSSYIGKNITITIGEHQVLNKTITQYDLSYGTWIYKPVYYSSGYSSTSTPVKVIIDGKSFSSSLLVYDIIFGDYISIYPKSISKNIFTGKYTFSSWGAYVNNVN